MMIQTFQFVSFRNRNQLSPKIPLFTSQTFFINIYFPFVLQLIFREKCLALDSFFSSASQCFRCFSSQSFHRRGRFFVLFFMTRKGGERIKKLPSNFFLLFSLDFPSFHIAFHKICSRGKKDKRRKKKRQKRERRKCRCVKAETMGKVFSSIAVLNIPRRPFP